MSVWNKGTKGICKPNSGSFKKGRIPWNKGKSLPKGEKANNWKGDDISYIGIHAWLRRTYGKAAKCENPKCEAEDVKRFEWALKKGFEYERKRENFIQLCKSCHVEYDDVLRRGWKTKKT